jgi:transcriptional regulator with XRE-family HTH domain
MKGFDYVYERLSNILDGIKGDKSYRDLSKDVGVSAFSLHGWIRRERLPTINNLNNLAQYMGISLYELLILLFDEQDSKQTPETLYSSIKTLSFEDKLKLLKYISDSIREDYLTNVQR